MEKKSFDVCIIGAGPAGYPGALRLARAGLRVALVEKRELGGTCLNRGCIPTKALRASADAFLKAKEAEPLGVSCEGLSFHFSRMKEHMSQVCGELRQGVAALLKKAKVEVLNAEAEVIGPGRVGLKSERGREELRCRELIIAGGSEPRDLPGIKIDEQVIMSSEGALRMESLPGSFIIVGGGVIGCEWADLLASLGVKVTVVEVLDRILPGEDRQTARAAQKLLEKRGVNIILKAAPEAAEVKQDQAALTLEDGRVIHAEKILVSVGRKPATRGMGLEPLGILDEQERVKVDDKGKTPKEGIWAAGDCIGPPMLAHAATHEMEVIADNLLGKPRKFEHETIPAVTFLRPPLASVGLLEDQAKKQGIPVKVGRFAYAASGKAKCLNKEEGFAKVVAAKENNVLLGGTVFGHAAAELIHELALAVRAKMPVEEFLRTVHAHPTLSEILWEAAADTQGLAIHKAKA